MIIGVYASTSFPERSLVETLKLILRYNRIVQIVPNTFAVLVVGRLIT